MAILKKKYKREAFNKFLLAGKTEDKIDYSHKRAVPKHKVHEIHRNSWETFVYITRPQTPSIQNFKEIGQ